MYCSDICGFESHTDGVYTKKVCLDFANTIKKNTVKIICISGFRKIAELFYFVMFPRRCGEGVFIQYINNICKSTVN